MQTWTARTGGQDPSRIDLILALIVAVSVAVDTWPSITRGRRGRTLSRAARVGRATGSSLPACSSRSPTAAARDRAGRYSELSMFADACGRSSSSRRFARAIATSMLASYLAIPVALCTGRTWGSQSRSSSPRCRSALFLFIPGVALAGRRRRKGLLDSMGRTLLGVLFYVFCAGPPRACWFTSHDRRRASSCSELLVAHRGVAADACSGRSHGMTPEVVCETVLGDRCVGLVLAGGPRLLDRAQRLVRSGPARRCACRFARGASPCSIGARPQPRPPCVSRISS